MVLRVVAVAVAVARVVMLAHFHLLVLDSLLWQLLVAGLQRLEVVQQLVVLGALVVETG
jgi:hypothetical protein